jgi:hypothetical protein
MFVTRRPTLTLALLLTVAWWPVSLAARCLYYGDVSLTGRLIQQTYPGPPDFESVTKGDQPLVIWLLQLDERVCIVSSSASYPNVYNRHLLGKRVAVTGRLLPGGGKYEKPQVITARSVEELF